MEQLSFPFSATVAPGDRLEIEHDGFTVAAIIHHARAVDNFDAEERGE